MIVTRKSLFEGIRVTQFCSDSTDMVPHCFVHSQFVSRNHTATHIASFLHEPGQQHQRIKGQTWQQQQHHPRQGRVQRASSAAPRQVQRALTTSADPLAASIVAAAEPEFAQVPCIAPFTKQQLLDVAATFVKLWFAGIAKGPQAVEQELAAILSSDVLIKADRVKHFRDTQVSLSAAKSSETRPPLQPSPSDPWPACSPVMRHPAVRQRSLRSSSLLDAGHWQPNEPKQLFIQCCNIRMLMVLVHVLATSACLHPPACLPACVSCRACMRSWVS